MRRAGLFMLVLGCTASAVAAQPPPAEDFLRRSEAGWQAVAATEPGSPARIAACDAQAEAGFDMAALARLVAGDFIWLRLGASLQPRFVAALRSRLVTDCTRRQGAGTLALLASRPRDGGVSVTARWHAPGSDDRTLVWRLRPGGPWGWQASDVAADGVSLSAVLHEEVRAAFDAAGGDPDAAIAGLARGAPLP